MTDRADIRAAVEARLKRRHRAEARFRIYGLLAIAVAIGFLAILLGRVIQQGHTAFWTHSVELPVLIDPAQVDPAYPAGANFDQIIAEQLAVRLGAGDAPEAVAKVRGLLSPDMGFQIADRLREDPSLIGRTLDIEAPVSDEADLYLKGEIERASPEDERNLSDRQLDWLDRMQADGLVEAHFNSGFFTRSDSTQPETAGLLGAIVGSALMLLVTAVLAIPIGVTGAVEMDGENINDPKLDPVALRARVGMVFQRPNPFPKSIFENVAYGPRIHGLTKSKSELQDVVERALRRAGLWAEVSDRLDQPGTSLSGGQQQRLVIARAIAVDPEVILMDEPCSALDPIATARIEELIDELREQYCIVIVTHSMAQAARVSQTTAFFHMGRIVETGRTDEVFTKPRDPRTLDYITGRFG